MIVLFLSIFYFLLVQPVSAQIPLSHLLVQAYKPSSLYLYQPPSTTQGNPVLGQSISATTDNLPTTQTPMILDGHSEPITIAILGDSMIDTLGEFSYLKKSLQDLYPNYVFNIVNYGLGASHIEYGLYRLDNDYQNQETIYPSLISQNPNIVIIESFAYNNFGNTQAGFDRHWLALGAITTKLKEKLPKAKILLAATIAPNSAIFGNGAPDINYSALEKISQTKTIGLYLKNTINFAKSQNFPIIDAYTPSLKNNDGNPLFINKSDNIHPSVLGGQFFSDIVLQTFQKYKIIE